MSFYQRHQKILFGTWLRKLGDKFLGDLTAIYKALDIPFESGWFPIFYLLSEKGALSITQIAHELEITHSAVSQMVATLESKALISFTNDKDDRRRRLVVFTEKGEDLLEILKPVWSITSSEMEGILVDKQQSAALFTALKELEASLHENSICDRVLRVLEQRRFDRVKVIQYDPAFKSEFKNLMLAALIEFEGANVFDEDLIKRPEEEIRLGCNVVLLAKDGNNCIGAIAAEIKSRNKSNISFLFVEESWRGRGVGRRLLAKLLEQLQASPVRKVYLKIDRDLTRVIKLFKAAGFELDAISTEEHRGRRKEMTLRMVYSME